ncbi:glycoside hydrolase family 32 protein [Flavobacterium granuli]|uniref:Levanase/fructan beta-fructosidase n=1 Tax=Flavobacterium granuli TaxID=280093 RepID=A0ABU1S0F1_9FLAO|nr:glycoside hydrolase family 32 protein [Flavobacterium granuli]MDR6844466.1 levanase/fructan beta-fructosidase [Flavobacterium granuli]
MKNTVIKGLFKSIFFILMMVIMNGCSSAIATDEKIFTNEELYRPNLHFTPNKGWMNDPNGLFFYKGLYHLYFQHYPDKNVWGPMHWGHATSKDMITWEEQKIALFPDEKGYIFSGSAVVDVHNTSGFGSLKNPPIVAMFTYHDAVKEKTGAIDYQSQAIAYSLDEGMTWTKFKGNPVIKNPGIKDFRDPKMTWDAIHNQWIMVLAADVETNIYRSSNLINWELVSAFGKNLGVHGSPWECPDFFPIKVEGSTEMKWVLLQSINPNGPNGGSATQYFVGDFDGKTFTLGNSFANDLKQETAFWVDYGKDNYAGVTWSNIPDTDGRKLFIGWMSNWEYANKVPTENWRSSTTIARELKLLNINGHYRIVSLPVKELDKYVSKTIKRDLLTIDKETVIVDKSTVDMSRLDIHFTMNGLKDDNYDFILSNKEKNALHFGINKKDKCFYIDRKYVSKTTFSDEFAKKISKAPISSDFSSIDVRIIIDKTSIEVFYDNGKTVMTEIYFTDKPMDSFSIAKANTAFELKNVFIKQLNIK